MTTTLHTMRSRFDAACAGLPAPGTGCHAALLGAANYGNMAGLSDAEIFTALRRAIKPGTRIVQDREINDAIRKSRETTVTVTMPANAAPMGWDDPIPAPAPRRTFDGKAAFRPAATRPKPPMDAEDIYRRQQRMIQAGGGEFDPLANLDRTAEGSNPDRGEWAFPSPAADVLTFLAALYDPDDLLYIGQRETYREKQRYFIRSASQWIDFFAAHLDKGTDPAELGRSFPFICCNPLNGKPLESGSWRSDANVSRFRYAVIEHDKLPLNQQTALIRALELPLVSLVFSGSKSIHALLDVTAYCGEAITTVERWRQVIAEGLFKTWLEPYAFDTANSNPSRLTRLPGVSRGRAANAPPAKPPPEPTVTANPAIPAPSTFIPETSSSTECWQRLLYINRRAQA